MTANLRVTLIQADLAWQDPATNRRNLAAHFRGLAGHTDLIVLPEMFTTGFSMDTAGHCEDESGPGVLCCSTAPAASMRRSSAA